MSPFVAVLGRLFRSPGSDSGTLLGVGLVVLIALSTPPSVWATDYNVDYPHVAPCAQGPFGGAALTLNGPATPTGTTGVNGTPYYINISSSAPSASSFHGYNPQPGQCSDGKTIISWANMNIAEPCITETVGTVLYDYLHLGVSVAEMNLAVSLGFVYGNNLSTQPCRATTNLPTTNTCAGPYTAYCEPQAARAIGRQRQATPQVNPVGYQVLVGASWQVHADGKTLTIINDSTWPPHSCRPVFIGNVRLIYFGNHQRLSTLNADSLREGFSEFDFGVNDTIACGDTLVLAGGPVPSGAHFVVATAIQDGVPTLDSPSASHIWLEEAVLQANEHLLTPGAGPHGSINPGEPLVVPEGSSQTFTITPDAGYQVDDVLVDGVSVGSVPTYTFSSVTANHTVVAMFEPINATPDCSHVTAFPTQLWPPNHRLVPVSISGVTDPNGDPVTTRVTRITQDEPQGSGNHAPDAVINSDGTCLLRAERAGNGNGRVYTIWFTADDGRGGLCDGSAQVCVPHDRDHLECIDDGRTINALVSSDEAGTAAAATTSKLELIGTAMVGRMATVEYSLPTAGRVHLSVYDVAGRRVAVVENQSLGEGTHKVTWDTSGLAHGVYFYRLQLGSATVSKSLMILR